MPERRVSGNRCEPPTWSVLSGSLDQTVTTLRLSPSGTEDAQLCVVTLRAAVSASCPPAVPAHATVFSAHPSASSGTDTHFPWPCTSVAVMFSVAPGISGYSLWASTPLRQSVWTPACFCGRPGNWNSPYPLALWNGLIVPPPKYI